MLAIHLTLCLCFIFKVPVPLFEQYIVSKYYKSYSALGPFFTDKSVSSTFLMGVTFKQENWSAWTYPQLESHQRYLNHFDYEQLKRAEFEKLMSWYANTINDQSPAFKDMLLGYLTRNYAKSRPVDSMAIMVLFRSANNGKICTDTLNVNHFSVP